MRKYEIFLRDFFEVQYDTLLYIDSKPIIQTATITCYL